MWGAQRGPMRPFGGGGGFIVGNEGERGWSAVKGGKAGDFKLSLHRVIDGRTSSVSSSIASMNSGTSMNGRCSSVGACAL